MCSLSWRTTGQDAASAGFELLFNRDELDTRARAEAPRPVQLGGLRALLPRDPDAGGTWIAVNEAGLCLSLLNGYLVETAGREFTTRGEIITRLIARATPPDARELERELDLQRYQSFTLVAIAAGAARVLCWDGARLERDGEAEALGFLTSSSYDQGAARELRREQRARRADAGALANLTDLHAFHTSHEPERGPFSVCMHRAEASTKSLTEVRVDSTRVSMAYADGAPCVTTLAPALTLARKRGTPQGRAPRP